MVDLASLPRSDKGIRTNYRGEKGRTVKTEWQLAEGTNDRGEPFTVVAQLSTSHSPDSKQYFTMLTQVVVTKGDTFTSERFDLFSGLTIRSSDRGSVARYSAKNLAAYHDESVATVYALAGSASWLPEAQQAKFDAQFAPKEVLV